MTVNNVNANIIDKIQNMLKTATNHASSEAEAQSAMLLAQKLMAKHGLEMADLEAHADDDQKKEVAKDYTEAAKTEWWQGRLANVIADNFKCFVYLNKWTAGKQRIVFVGLKEDAEIAKTIYMFAASVVPHLAKQYLKDRKKEAEKNSGYNFKTMTDAELYEMAENELSDFDLYELKNKYADDEKIYKMRMIMKIKEVLGLNIDAAGVKNDYISGFLSGLQAQFAEQLKQNQEWGLVLVKDKEVVEYYENLDLKKGKGSSAKASGDGQARAAGYQRGKSWSSPTGGIQG